MKKLIIWQLNNINLEKINVTSKFGRFNILKMFLEEDM